MHSEASEIHRYKLINLRITPRLFALTIADGAKVVNNSIHSSTWFDFRTQIITAPNSVARASNLRVTQTSGEK